MYDKLPPELKNGCRFVCWQYQGRESKKTKVPISPRGGPAKVNDPETWKTSDEAVKYSTDQNLSGIGIVLSKNLGDKLVGIDLDRCIDDAGNLTPEAKEIVTSLNSYTEITPSGRGLRIFVKGELPDGARRKGDVEIYDDLRYLTLTGNHLQGTPETVEARQDTIVKIWKKYISTPELVEHIKTDSPGNIVHKVDFVYGPDGELLQKARNAWNGIIFTKLWEGDWQGAGYPSQSEADLALCSHFAFWTNLDTGRIDALFRRSGLMRPKWDVAHVQGRTYGEETITKAVTGKVDGYQWKRREITESTVVSEKKDELGASALPSDSDIHKPFPFPDFVFPPSFRELYCSYADGLQVEPGLVAISMLTVLTGAIGNSIAVSLKEGWHTVLFLWFCFVAASGYGKSPMRAAVVKPVTRLQAKDSDSYQNALLEYEQALREQKKELDRRLPDRPYPVHRLVSDITIEALGDAFEKNGRGIIVDVDELAGLINGFDQYKGRGNDRQKWLSLFNADSWKIDRKSGTKFIKNTGAAILGGIQEAVLPTTFGNDAFSDGLFPRFLIYLTGKGIIKFNRQGISASVQEEWQRYVHYCYDLQVSYDDDGFITPMVLTLSDDALSLWEDFYNTQGRLRPFLSDRAQVFIAKLLDYYSVKFAGILHVLNAIDRKEGISPVISSTTVVAAIELTNFFIGQATSMLSLYTKDEALNEYQRSLIRVLFELREEVHGGQLQLKRIHRVFNDRLPSALRLSPERIASLTKSLGLSTRKGTDNLSCLIWEPEKMEKLFCKATVLSVIAVIEREQNAPDLNTESTESTVCDNEHQETADEVIVHEDDEIPDINSAGGEKWSF